MDRTPRSCRFGPFTLDVTAVELRRGGDIVELRPKCFDLLAYFLANPGRLIKADELLQSVWSGVVVNEGTINRTVTSLRAALGDDASNPIYIETVSRRGYKFIGAAAAEAAALPRADVALIHRGQEHLLRDGEHLIGRGADVAIPLYGSAISRHHARIVVAGAALTIEDLGSRNGTFVNGRRITERMPLHGGDEVLIGSDRLVVWSRSSATASAPSD